MKKQYNAYGNTRAALVVRGNAEEQQQHKIFS
jgi:hypothetical protein